MMMIECISLYGNKILIPKGKLVIRPTVYGIIPNDGTILLVSTRHTGKYHLPGGGIEPGERMEEALKREVREETGIEIEVGQFVRFKEEFFYYDPLDKAFHSFLFFYVCRPKTFDLVDDSQVDDEEAEKPRWVDKSSLQAEDFNSHGEVILEILDSV